MPRPRENKSEWEFSILFIACLKHKDSVNNDIIKECWGKIKILEKERTKQNICQILIFHTNLDWSWKGEEGGGV